MGSVLVVLAPPAAAATTRFVAMTGSDSVPAGNQCTNSLQPCRTITRAHLVSASGGGDTISVSGGTYVERLTITKGVTIQGAGAASTIIDSNSTSTTGGPVMVVNIGDGLPLTINAVTLTRGFSNFFGGGGISLFTGNVVVNDSAVTANNSLSGLGGGGIAVVGTAFGTAQNLTLNRVTVSANTATNGVGGGIWSAGPVTLIDSTITNNRATGSTATTGLGGGIALTKAVAGDAPALNATRATLSLNTAISGAGLYSTGQATFTDSTFSQNTGNASSGVGGGIDVVKAAATDLAAVTLDHTTLSKNSAAFGGGAGVNGGGQLTVRNGSTFDQNSSAFGGGLYNAGATTITDSAFTANTSSFQGGAIWDGSFAAADTPTIAVTNTAITGNTAASLAGGVLVVNAASYSMTGGSLSTNTAVSAGGMYVQGTGTAAFTGTNLAGNKATNGNGGGIWVSGALSLTNATLTTNVATGTVTTGFGGGVFVGETVAADTPSAVINSSTFRTNNAGWVGGAVAVGAGSTATMSPGSLLDQNTAISAGGLYVQSGGTATLTGTTLSRNAANTGFGGAAFNAGALTLTDGAVDQNTALHAGGLYVAETGTTGVTRTAITNNQANGGATNNAGNGGGAFNAGSLTITDALVSGNQANTTTAPSGTNIAGEGGAIMARSTVGTAAVKTTILRSTLTGNSAAVGGALVTFSSAGTNGASILNSTIHANSATTALGVVTAVQPISIVGTTFTQNTAAAGGTGGIWQLSPGLVRIAGSILYGNTSGAATVNCAGAPADGGYNLTNAGDASCGFTAGPPKNDVFVDPQLGPLANNGGPTQTRLPAPSSPVINKIPPATATGITDPVTTAAIVLCPTPAGSSTDQRGVARPQGSTCDIGSVEVANVAPVITSADNTTFVVGSAGAFLVTTSGTPPPALSVSGALPAGVTFVDNGNGTATLAGTPAANTGGTYPLTITATNGTSPNATQNFTLTVNQAPAITSANNTTFVVGTGGTFLVTTTGFPKPALSATGALPAGVSFVDNGNGTATLAGTPGPNTGGTYTLQITATNGVGSPATQTFTLTVNQAPTLTGPTAQPTFVVGTPNSIGFTATGFPTPSLSSSPLPAGLSFTDNGNGSGTISGTALGPPSSTLVTVTASNGVNPNATVQFTLVVINPLVITTNALPDGTVGTPYSATLGASGGTPPYTWSVVSGSLPAGLGLNSTTGEISGTPAGPRGTSTFTVQATDTTNPMQTATRQLSIEIHATPTTLVADPALVRVVFPGVFVTFQTIKAHLYAGASNTPVAGATIRFTVGGNLYCNAVTDATGTAQCPGFNAALALALVLSNGFDATYAGSPTLEPAAAHGPLILVS